MPKQSNVALQTRKADGFVKVNARTYLPMPQKQPAIKTVGFSVAPYVPETGMTAEPSDSLNAETA